MYQKREGTWVCVVSLCDRSGRLTRRSAAPGSEATSPRRTQKAQARRRPAAYAGRRRPVQRLAVQGPSPPSRFGYVFAYASPAPDRCSRASCVRPTVNRVATRASPPYPRAICGSEKVLESWPEMRLGKVGAAVAEEVDRAEDRCPVGQGAAVQQAAGGGADGDALAGAGDDGCDDEQRQCAGGDRCDDADHSGQEGDHADALGCRGCEPAADGSAENAGGHVGGEHQSEDERAAGVELIFDQRGHEGLVEGSGRPGGQEHRGRDREQMPDPGRYADPGVAVIAKHPASELRFPG